MKEKEIRFYDFSEYRLDVINKQLLRDEQPIEITNKSLKVLQFLIENRGDVLKKEHLIDALWNGAYVEEKTLMQHIYMLRKALKQNGDNETYIKTISKNGYSFVAEVEEIFIESSEINEEVSENQNESLETDNNTKSEEKEASKTDTTISNKKVGRKPIFSKAFAYVTAASLVFLSSIIFAYSSFQSSNGNSDSQEIKSIAVLPFQQFGDGKKERLGLIVADTLISEIGKFNQLSVAPTSSITHYFGKDSQNVYKIGEKLNVDAVVKGTIQTDGNRYRVAVRLYNVKDRKQIWAETFDERYFNKFAMQDKISEQISKGITQNIPSLRNDFIQMKSALKITAEEDSCKLAKKNKSKN